MSVVSDDEQDFVGVDPACCDEFLEKVGDSVRGLKGECEFVKDEWNRGISEKCQLGLVTEMAESGDGRVEHQAEIVENHQGGVWESC